MKKHILTLCILLLGCASAIAQVQADGEGPVEKEAPAKKTAHAEKYLTEAKQHIAEENWRESALSLGKIVELGGVPPAEFYFLLGKTFIRGKNFENGKQLLQDYLSMTGGKGEYQKQTLALMQEVNDYEKGKCQVCAGKGSIEGRYKCAKCYGFGFILEEDKKCYGHGYESCGTCGGSGRVREGTRTFTCPTCDGKGKVKCPWCRGTGHVRNTPCETCGRSGSVTSQIYCKHCDGDGRIDDNATVDRETDDAEADTSQKP